MMNKPGEIHTPDLDDNLRVKDSIMVQDRPQTGVQFDDRSDRGMVRRFQLKALSIGSDDIADNSVTGPKIAANAVSNTKIASFNWNKGTGGTISNATIGTIIGGNYNSATLGSVTINQGSDATGDMYYRNASGAFTRLSIGTTNQILASNGTVPAWSTSSATLSSKTISTTRDLTSASGDVSYTSVGFTPTSIICFYGIEGAVYGGMGFSDSAKTNYSKRTDASAVLAFNTDLVCVSSAAGGFQEAIVKSFDADGFTLTWTKTSSPTGTVQLRFLCFR